MAIGILIIGDEILSGKRQDKHLTRAIQILGARGLELAWASYLGDDPARITETLKRTFATDDIVFSFGGIGATPTTTPGNALRLRWAGRSFAILRPCERSRRASARRLIRVA